jgi:cell division septation protein DedD
MAAGWAAEVALDVAQGWGAGGCRIVLADAGLETPQLASALGVLPGEGLVDALRWGASVRRVARRPEGRPFFVVTSGTPVADGAAVLNTPRWQALCAGFRDAGVTLVALVPAADPCLDGVLGEATHAVIIATPGEGVSVRLGGFGGEILGVVGREEEAPVAAARADPEGESEPDLASASEPDVAPEPEPEAAAEPFEPVAAFGVLPDAMESGTGAVAESAALDLVEDASALPDATAPGLSADEPAFQPVAGVSWDAEAGEARDPLAPAEGGAWTDPLGPIDDASGDAVIMRRAAVPTFEEIVQESDAGMEEEPRRRRVWVIALVLILGAALAAAAWVGWLPVPGLRPGGPGQDAPQAPADAAIQGAGPSLAAGPAHAVSELLAMSLALGAYQDAGAARALVEQVAAAVPGMVVLAVPAQVEGRTLHRVLAGPVADSAAALALAGEIALASGLDATGWLPRSTPKAYQLGEMADLDAARRRALVLADLEVPAYVLAVAYSDGSVRFRVYAGAFADEAEASLLSGLLVERGLSSATFSDRIGHLPE